MIAVMLEAPQELGRSLENADTTSHGCQVDVIECYPSVPAANGRLCNVNMGLYPIVSS